MRTSSVILSFVSAYVCGGANNSNRYQWLNTLLSLNWKKITALYLNNNKDINISHGPLPYPENIKHFDLL